MGLKMEETVDGWRICSREMEDGSTFCWAWDYFPGSVKGSAAIQAPANDLGSAISTLRRVGQLVRAGLDLDAAIAGVNTEMKPWD